MSKAKRTFKTNLNPQAAPVPAKEAKSAISQEIKSTSFRLPGQELQDLKEVAKRLKGNVKIPVNSTTALRVAIKLAKGASDERLVKILRELI